MDNFPSIQTILDEFIQHISEQPPVSAADLPNIDLYMAVSYTHLTLPTIA